MSIGNVEIFSNPYIMAGVCFILFGGVVATFSVMAGNAMHRASDDSRRKSAETIQNSQNLKNR